MVDEPTGRLSVAIGPTRAAAARAFGGLFDDLLLTTFDEMAQERAVETATTIAFADGPGLEEALAPLIRNDHTTQLLVEIPDDRSRRQWLIETLQSHPGTGVVHAQPTPDGGTAIELGPSSPESVSGRAVSIMLAGFPRRGISDGGALWPKQVDVEADLTRLAEFELPEPGRDRSAAEPASSRRLGRRAWLFLGLVLVLSVLAAIGLIPIGRTDRGAHGVTVAAVVWVALLELAGLAGLTYLVRSQRQMRRDLDAFRESTGRDLGRLVAQGVASRKRAIKQGKHIAELRKATSREEAHHEYVVELGRQLTRELRGLTDDSR